MKKILAVGIIALLAIGGMATMATAKYMDSSGDNDRMQGWLQQYDGTCDAPNDGYSGLGGSENGNGPGDGSGDGECDNLTTGTGTWSQDGIWYYLDGVRLHVGPYGYLAVKDALYDYDNDGDLETIAGELDGLDGQTVTVNGPLHEGPMTWLSVFYINDMLYREEGRPIWAGGHR